MGSQAPQQLYVAVLIRDSTTGIVIDHSMYMNESTTAGQAEAFWRAKTHSFDLVKLSIGGQDMEKEEAVLAVMGSRGSFQIDLDRSEEMTQITIRDTLTGELRELHMWIQPTTNFEHIKRFWSNATGGRTCVTKCISGSTRCSRELLVLPLLVENTVTIEWNGERMPDLLGHRVLKRALKDAITGTSSSDSDMEEARAPVPCMEAGAPDWPPVPTQHGTPLKPNTVHIHIVTAGQPGHVGLVWVQRLFVIRCKFVFRRRLDVHAQPGHL